MIHHFFFLENGKEGCSKLLKAKRRYMESTDSILSLGNASMHDHIIEHITYTYCTDSPVLTLCGEGRDTAKPSYLNLYSLFFYYYKIYFSKSNKSSFRLLYILYRVCFVTYR